MDSAVVVYGADSEVAYVEDSKARALVAISLRTYTQTTLAPTSSRLVDCEWMVILAPPPALPLSMAAAAAAGGEEEEEEVTAVALTQSLANRSWFGMYVPPSRIPFRSR